MTTTYYVIISEDNIVRGFETRNLPLEELVHPDFWHLYIPVTTLDGVELEAIYDPTTKTFTNPTTETTEAV